MAIRTIPGSVLKVSFAAAFGQTANDEPAFEIASILAHGGPKTDAEGFLVPPVERTVMTRFRGCARIADATVSANGSPADTADRDASWTLTRTVESQIGLKLV